MSLYYLLELFGIAVFASAGALEAGRSRMDIFGVLVIGAVTALGGGTLRNLILDVHPVPWIADIRLIWVALISASITFFFARQYRFPFTALLVADAVGLAVFVIAGTHMADQLQLPAIIVVMMGVMTGIFGGILRDILCNEIPLIFRKDIYATAAIAGAVFYILLQKINPDATYNEPLAMMVILVIRLAAIRYHLALPRWLSASMPQDNNNES